jgi:hypothetical protein
MKLATSLLLVIALMFVGVSARAYAFCKMEPMTSTVEMAMEDCPMHQAAKPMKMEPTKCALYCYSLAPVFTTSELPVAHMRAHAVKEALPLSAETFAAHIPTVPTPPPNFA